MIYETFYLGKITFKKGFHYNNIKQIITITKRILNVELLKFNQQLEQTFL